MTGHFSLSEVSVPSELSMLCSADKTNSFLVPFYTFRYSMCTFYIIKIKMQN